MDAPDYDVVVVGAGGAGLAAAATAAEQGASVLLVEAAEQVGGSTAYAAGSFMAAGTPTQEAAGHPVDTVEEFVDYYTALNQWQVDPPVVRRFCEEATPTMRWLTGLGVEFAPAGLYRAQLERIPRSHRPVGAGQALVDALHAAVRASGADVALGNRVDGLLTSEGRVHGVSARGEAVTATSVVVTTGGFGANGDLVREHMPEVAKAGEWVWSPAAPTCLGDGLGLAVKAGAATTGAGKGEVLLTPGFGRELEPFLPGWLVFVNAAGRRFVNEAAPYAALSKLVSAEGGRCFVVMDEATRAAARPNPASAMFGGGSWEADFIAARAGEGRIARAATIEDLAARLGVPAVMLASTVERYNADAALGVDSRFDKAAAHLRPIATPPFYGIEIRAAVVAVTGFGVRIDADGRVLAEEDDRPVPGLYAAGEVVGNVLGPLYLGGGNAVGSAIVFGRVAGRAAAGAAGRP